MFAKMDNNIIFEAKDGSDTFKILKKPIGDKTAYGSEKFRYVKQTELPLKADELRFLSQRRIIKNR